MKSIAFGILAAIALPASMVSAAKCSSGSPDEAESELVKLCEEKSTSFLWRINTASETAYSIVRGIVGSDAVEYTLKPDPDAPDSYRLHDVVALSEFACDLMPGIRVGFRVELEGRQSMVVNSPCEVTKQ